MVLFRRMKAFFFGLTAIAMILPASAQTYPARPITLVVPFSAGGFTDVLARQLGKSMQSALGQPVVIDNRPGAGGIIGAEKVAKAKPDGYTLLVTTTAHVVNPALTRSLPYDTKRDFNPVALLATTPNVLVVNPSVPAKNLPELLAFAKKTGGVTYGSSGIGGTTHLSGELLAAMTGAPFLHVPYKGTAVAVNDLLGGQIHASFVDAPTASKFIKGEKLRAIAVSTAARNPALPDVPTIAEQGVPGYETMIWIGFYAPAGTPADVLTRLNQVAVTAMNDQQFRKMLVDQGAEPGNMNVQAFGRFVSSELVKWRKIVSDANLLETVSLH
jgi:tripartite-type tricarboxylate transporter receptor subunit TctC